MPAMAAIIILLGANMINWEDIKPHFKDRGDTVVFLASFLSVLFLDLFGAVVVGSILAIAYSKWQQAHPNISLRGNVMKIRGNIYYGSLPVIEATYHAALARDSGMVIDFSECYYIDAEGIRWLAAVKEASNTRFTDRRRAENRRTERRADGEGERASDGRRRKPDRRQRSDL